MKQDIKEDVWWRQLNQPRNPKLIFYIFFFHELSLVPDVYRVIHQILSYKSANVPIFGKKNSPNNENQVSLISENRIHEPVWTNGLIMLQSLIDLLDESYDDEPNEKEVEIEQEDYETDDEDEE